MRVYLTMMDLAIAGLALAGPVTDLRKAVLGLSGAHHGGAQAWDRFCGALSTDLNHEKGSLRQRIHAADARAFRLGSVRVEIRDHPGIREVTGRRGAIFQVAVSGCAEGRVPEANILVLRTRHGYECCAVESVYHMLPEMMVADTAIARGDRLLLGGVMDDGSNSPRGAVEAFVRNGQGWTRTSRVVTVRESWEGAVPTADGHGIVIVTRGDLDMVSPAHCGPRPTWAEEYRLKKGRLAHTASYRRRTAVSALNDLVLAVHRRDRAALRGMCLTAKLARRVMSFAARLAGRELTLRSNASSVTDEDRSMFLPDAGLWVRFARRHGRMVLVEVRERRGQ